MSEGRQSTSSNELVSQKKAADLMKVSVASVKQAKVEAEIKAGKRKPVVKKPVEKPVEIKSWSATDRDEIEAVETPIDYDNLSVGSPDYNKVLAKIKAIKDGIQIPLYELIEDLSCQYDRDDVIEFMYSAISAELKAIEAKAA
jgi:hypothetical protein